MLKTIEILHQTPFLVILAEECKRLKKVYQRTDLLVAFTAFLHLMQFICSPGFEIKNNEKLQYLK